MFKGCLDFVLAELSKSFHMLSAGWGTRIRT
jgi:hypothetical protein